MVEFDEKLGSYVVTDNEDGTKDIAGVPIFKLGLERDGKVYDGRWAKSAIKAHNDIKADAGYVPPLFIGHTKDDEEEKPAVGAFDNLRLVSKEIVADLVKVPAKIYAELKEGMWPGRSVEAINSDDDNRILGLALLGASTPACKFKPLSFQRFDGNPDDVDVIEFKHDVFTAEEMDKDHFQEAVATGITYDLLRNKIAEELNERLSFTSNATNSTGVQEEAHVWVKEIFIKDPIAIIEHDADVFSVKYVIGDDNEVAVTNMIRVEERYIPLIEVRLEAKEKPNKEVGNMTDAEKKLEDEKIEKEAADLKAKEEAEAKEKAEKDAADLKAKKELLK